MTQENSGDKSPKNKREIAQKFHQRKKEQGGSKQKRGWRAKTADEKAHKGSHSRTTNSGSRQNRMRY